LRDSTKAKDWRSVHPEACLYDPSEGNQNGHGTLSMAALKKQVISHATF